MLIRLTTFLIGVFAAQFTLAETAPVRPLKIGFPEGLPGYELMPSGEMQFAVPSKKKITECIEKGLNARFIWEAYPTKRVMQMLIENKVDLAFPMGFTEERAAKMLQTPFAWENADYFLSMRPVDIHDKNLRIAARLGSPQHTDYAAEGYTRVTATYTYEELIRALTTNMTDVVIIPQSVYEDQKNDWPAATIITVGRARNTGAYLNKDDPAGLRESLNKNIVQCRVKVLGK